MGEPRLVTSVVELMRRRRRELVMAVQFYRQGTAPVPLTEMGRIASELEAMGWDGLVVPEAAAVCPDPYVCLALAAVATTTLKLGTAVLVPVRHPQWAAGAMACVQAVSGGRASFTIGRGDGAVLMLGQKPVSVDVFAAYVERVQRYLRRQEVDLDGFPSSMTRLFAVDSSLDRPKPPVYVAATGPRVTEVGARLADGIDFSVGADAERLAACIERARAARSRAGLDPDAMTFGSYVQVVVTNDPDRAAARERIKGLVMTHSRFSGYFGRPLRDVAEEDKDQTRRAAHAMDTLHARPDLAPAPGASAGEVRFYPDAVQDPDFIDRFAVIGSPEYCAERLRPLLDVGVHRLLVGVRDVGSDPAETNAARFARDVIPLLRSG
jgi:5,10-methylenetetrahydromethanopterin reductase